MSLQQFFQWASDSGLGNEIRNSTWQFAVVQAFHLVGVATFIGALLIVDLRLLGQGIKQQPVKQIARDAQPWLLWSLVLIVVTGIPQFAANALKYYASPPFYWKMGILVLATIYHFTIRQMVLTRGNEARFETWGTKAVAVVSIVLWTGVIVGGRIIGFY